jgi:hypothetical protein
MRIKLGNEKRANMEGTYRRNDKRGAKKSKTFYQNACSGMIGLVNEAIQRYWFAKRLFPRCISGE